jgi:hypothetical protein
MQKISSLTGRKRNEIVGHGRLKMVFFLDGTLTVGFITYDLNSTKRVILRATTMSKSW